MTRSEAWIVTDAHDCLREAHRPEDRKVPTVPGDGDDQHVGHRGGNEREQTAEQQNGHDAHASRPDTFCRSAVSKASCVPSASATAANVRRSSAPAA